MNVSFALCIFSGKFIKTTAMNTSLSLYLFDIKFGLSFMPNEDSPMRKFRDLIFNPRFFFSIRSLFSSSGVIVLPRFT